MAEGCNTYSNDFDGLVSVMYCAQLEKTVHVWTKKINEVNAGVYSVSVSLYVCLSDTQVYASGICEGHKNST
jgi:hypothetical protein